METTFRERVVGPAGPYVIEWTFDDSEGTRRRFGRAVELLVELADEQKKRKPAPPQEEPR